MRVYRSRVSEARRHPLIRVFRNREYAIYFAGNGISLIGTWVQRLSVGWLTWKLTHSSAWVGAVGFADLFPALIIGPFAGVLADRFDRTRILLITQSIALLQAIALWALVASGHVSVGWVFALTLGLGVLAAVTQPARLSLIPQIVRLEDLNTALALNSVLFNSARFIGPMIAGVLIDRIDLSATFAFNAFSFLAMVTALLYIPPTKSTRAQRDVSVLAELREGIAYSARHASIGPLLLMSTAVAVLCKPIADLLPGFAGAVFQRDEQGLVILTSAMGIGSFVAGMWLAQRETTRGLARIVVLSITICSAALIAFAYMPTFALAVVLLTLVSATISISGTSAQTLVQLLVDDDKRGRVMALWGLIFRGAPALGVLAIGLLSRFFGLNAPVAAAALLCLLFGWFATRWARPLAQAVLAHQNSRPPA